MKKLILLPVIVILFAFSCEKEKSPIIGIINLLESQEYWRVDKIYENGELIENLDRHLENYYNDQIYYFENGEIRCIDMTHMDHFVKCGTYDENEFIWNNQECKFEEWSSTSFLIEYKFNSDYYNSNDIYAILFVVANVIEK